MTLGEALHLSDPQPSHLCNGEEHTLFRTFLVGLKQNLYSLPRDDSKGSQTEGFKPQKAHLSQFGGEKSKVKASAEPVPSDGCRREAVPGSFTSHGVPFLVTVLSSSLPLSSPRLLPRSLAHSRTVSPCLSLSPRCRCPLPAQLWTLTLLKCSKRALHLSLRERSSDEKQAERKRSSNHPALILKQLAALPSQGFLPGCLEPWAVSSQTGASSSPSGRACPRGCFPP